MTAYIDSKTAQLEPVLQDFLYEDMSGWSQAPLPSEPRDICLELVFSLVMFTAHHKTRLGIHELLLCCGAHFCEVKAIC